MQKGQLYLLAQWLPFCQKNIQKRHLQLVWSTEVVWSVLLLYLNLYIHAPCSFMTISMQGACDSILESETSLQVPMTGIRSTITFHCWGCWVPLASQIPALWKLLSPPLEIVLNFTKDIFVYICLVCFSTFPLSIISEGDAISDGIGAGFEGFKCHLPGKVSQLNLIIHIILWIIMLICIHL